ncbi:gem-associated protein 6 [Electrophorus electricus]|uniref:Gem-associated protein 6 n=1 Tax=Electrophorus electricus TaxID=8005 RepID=A0AAY5EIE2_ELEEL|nr:gem-associated protein 6 [Electrophorus electricus]
MSEWCNMLPQEWYKYVNQEVKVTTRDKQQHEGWVFTVDPVSASVVLVTFLEKGGAFVMVVLGHAVRDVQILRGGDDEIASRLRSLFMPAGCQAFTSQKLKERKENLHAWLEKNRIPVTDEGDVLQVANVLTIGAPYGAEQCTSSNEIILARVQSLVESNPGTESQQ